MEYHVGEVAEHLKMLRDSFSNEIPSEIVHSNSRNNKFKVRKAWFQGVQANASNLVSEGCISDESLIGDIELFTQRVTSMEFIEQLTRPEDIASADELINKLINAIEGRYTSL